MSFALDSLGTEIVQTGTDASLAGLTTILSGGGQSSSVSVVVNKTIYNLGNYKLTINGDLTITPTVELLTNAAMKGDKARDADWLKGDSSASITINDFYRARNAATGTITYYENTAIEDQGRNEWGHHGNVNFGGKITMNGGKIIVGGRITINNFQCIEGTIESRIYGNGLNSILQMGNPSVITQLHTRRISNELNASVNYAGLIMEGSDGHRYTLSGSGTVTNLQVINCPSLIRGDSISYLKFKNDATGTSEKTVGGQYTNSDVDDIQRDLEINRDVHFSVKDTQGANVKGARVYVPDYNNSKRFDTTSLLASLFGASKPQATFDALYNRSRYELTTDANGQTPTTEILLMTWNGYHQTTVQSRDGSNNSGVQELYKDYRSKNGNNTDQFDYFTWSYEHQPVIRTISLKGNNTLEVAVELSDDALITEKDTTAVAAYTSLDTAQKIYDYVKNWKLSNLTLPTLSALPVARSASTINCANYDVIIGTTYSATSAYKINDICYHSGGIQKCTATISTGEAFTASKWTKIASGVFHYEASNIYLISAVSVTAGITTTGTVALSPNASISGEITATRVIAGQSRATGTINGSYEVTLPLTTTGQTITKVVVTGGSGELTLKNSTITTLENKSASAITAVLRGTLRPTPLATNGAITLDDNITITFSGLPKLTGSAIVVVEQLDASNNPLATPVYYDLTANETTGMATLGVPANTHLRWKADALGYHRSNSDNWTLLKPSISTTVDVSLIEIMNASNTRAYNSGNAARLALISFDAATLENRFQYSSANSTFYLEDAVDFLENVLTSHSSIKANFDQPSIDFNKKIITFVDGSRLRLSDHPSNTGRVELKFTINTQSDQTPKSILKNPFNTKWGISVAYESTTVQGDGLTTDQNDNINKAVDFAKQAAANTQKVI